MVDRIPGRGRPRRALRAGAHSHGDPPEYNSRGYSAGAGGHRTGRHGPGGMSFRRWSMLPLLGTAIFVLLLAACDDGSDPSLSKPFNKPPWTGAETLGYNLVEQDGRVAGTCQLKTTPEAEPG